MPQFRHSEREHEKRCKTLKSIFCVNIGNLKKILNESECLYACGTVFFVGGWDR